TTSGEAPPSLRDFMTDIPGLKGTSKKLAAMQQQQKSMQSEVAKFKDAYKKMWSGNSATKAGGPAAAPAASGAAAGGTAAGATAAAGATTPATPGVAQPASAGAGDSSSQAVTLDSILA